MSKGSILGLIAAVIIGGLAACGQSNDSAVPDGTSGPSTAITIKPTDIIRGDPKAPITMLEYASMTCPHCARWDQEVFPKLLDTYIKTGKVRYIFREFPLDGAARMASSLARCQSGDNFYAFIDLLFRNQPQWVKDFSGDGQISKDDIEQGLVQMGRVAGMGEDQVKTCINDPKNLKIVDDNSQEATALYGVEGTPTFILGDQIHRAEWTWEELDKKLKAMIAAHH